MRARGLGGLTAALSGTLLPQAMVVGAFGAETKRRALDGEAVAATEPAPAHGDTEPIKAMAGPRRRHGC